jgi:hypothetical protein
MGKARVILRAFSVASKKPGFNEAEAHAPRMRAPSAAALDAALKPLIEVISAAPPEERTEAEAKITALKQEVARAKDANDGAIAKLVDGLVGLVPAATSAVVSAFATPILGGIAGPVTDFVLDKLRDK